MENSIATTPSATEHYEPGTTGWIKFDVTELIQDLVRNPKTNYGFVVDCINDIPNNSIGQFSELNSMRLLPKRPKLTIRYDSETSAVNGSSNHITATEVKLKTEQLQIESSISDNVTISIFTSKGEMIKSLKSLSITSGLNTVALQQRLTPGFYIISISGNSIKRVFKQTVSQ